MPVPQATSNTRSPMPDERHRPAEAPTVRGCIGLGTARIVQPPARSCAIVRVCSSPIPSELVGYSVSRLRHGFDLVLRWRSRDILDGARNGDRTDILTSVIEDRRRQAVNSMQHLVGCSPHPVTPLAQRRVQEPRVSKSFAVSTLLALLQGTASSGLQGRTLTRPCRGRSHGNSTVPGCIPKFKVACPCRTSKTITWLSTRADKVAGCAGFIAEPRHFLPGDCKNVEALSQPFPENEQFDARCVTQSCRLLMRETVQHESLKMAIDGALDEANSRASSETPRDFLNSQVVPISAAIDRRFR